MNRFLTHLIDFLFPAVCHICGNHLTPHERFACSHCLSKLPRTGYHRRKLNPMEERFAGQFPFEKATGHFFYTRDSALSCLIQDMKYRHFPSIGNMLGNLAAAELFPTGFFTGIDVIVPVPMHFIKEARRGYNQTKRIAHGISEATGINVEYALKASRPHRTQTSLSIDQRRVNTSGIFTVALPSAIKGKHVLLVDDICTTGATLSEAATTLWKGNPNNLSVLSIGTTF